MRRIPANQLTQQHYGSTIKYEIRVKRGASVHTMILGHVLYEGGKWVIIRAKGAHPFDAVRIPADSLVEVRSS